MMKWLLTYQKKILELVLFGYTLLLSYWMLFGFHRMPSSEYHYNLVPFQTLQSFMDIGQFNVRSWLINVIGNIAVFVPFGLFVPWVRGRNSWIGSFVWFLAGLLILELLQLLTRRGSFDVDDLLLNSIGFACGYLWWSVRERLTWSRHLIGVTLCGGLFGILVINISILSAMHDGQRQSDLFIEKKADAVIVLGSAVHGDALSSILLSRMQTATAWVRQFPEMPIILSGGQGPGENVSEAKAMRNYLELQGVIPKHLLLEDRSTSTRENIQNSLQMLREHGMKSGMILIITSDFHMYRAKMLMREHGVAALGLAAPTPVGVNLFYLIRENLALTKDWLLSFF